jgi:AcrR family transcriptional regulator
MTPPTADQGRQTRSRIIGRAVDRASIEGLESLSFGELAKDLRLSKAGVAGPFGSKEALQLAAFDRAVQIFREHVWDPAADMPAGRRRLEAVCGNWLSYLEHCPFPGGCVVTTASVEWDARSGPVHDAVATAQKRWLAVLSAEADVAIRTGELSPVPDARQLAFELNGIAMSLNQAIQLLGDSDAPNRARRALDRLMAAA